MLITRPMDDWKPFEAGRGLVGGRGEDRAARRRVPPYAHRTVLRPYDVPEELETGRQFFAPGGTPIEVEIGYGRGHHACDRILQAPTHRFLLFEVRKEWVVRTAGWLDREKLDSARLIHDDARPLLMRLFEPGSVAAFSVFFPDPWWKKRHLKRRVMSPDLIEVMHRLLAPGGLMHFRTDVHSYFEIVEGLFAAHDGFERVDADHDSEGRRLPLTHREKKCEEFDIPVNTLCARKRG